MHYSQKASFPLTGEPLALDLINTRPMTPAGIVDLLATPENLGAWLSVQRHRLPHDLASSPEMIDDAALAEVHRVREHAAMAIDHARRGRETPATVLAALNEALKTAPAYRELLPGGVPTRIVEHRMGSLPDRLAAWLAGAVADLISDPAGIRIRKCEAHDCVMLFLPASPRRRWCSASGCGNRMRVARHYHRRKGEREHP